MNKIITFLIAIGIILISARVCIAQQQPINSQYMYNTLTINPAFAGYYDQVDFTFSGQGQLNGIEGSPSTAMFTMSLPFRKIGVGATFINDKAGPVVSNSVRGSYAFKLISKNKNSYTNSGFFPTTLSLALEAGLTMRKEDLLQLNAVNDPNFLQNINTIIPTFGVGIYYSKKNFYAGFSSPQLLTGNESTLNRHYYLNGGFVLKLDRDWLLKPNGLIKYTEGAPIQFDVNGIFAYRNKLDIGLGYRSASAINFLVGFTVSNHIRIVYSYNPPTQNVLLNTNSLLLNVRLGKGFTKNYLE